MRFPWIPSLALLAACTPVLPELTFTDAVKHPTAALLSVGGTGPDDVWLVGAQVTPLGAPLVLHGDGTNWTEVATGQLHDLWWVHAFEEGPVFIGGAGATVLRIEDELVERQTMPELAFAGQTVYGVWGPTPDDVWAVGGFAGRAGFAWRFDGTSWRDVPLPLELPRNADGEVPAILKAWGRSASDVWLVGGHGTVLHWDGTDFTLVPSGTTDTLFTVHGDADEVVIVGGGASGKVLRGTVAGLVDDTPAGAPLLQGVRVDQDGTTWVAGADAFSWAKPKGGEWSSVDLGFAEAPQSVHAMWADGEGGVWAAGGSVLSPALDKGAVCTSEAAALWEPMPIEPPVTVCPADAVDPEPEGTIARRWGEQLLNAIRRDIPHPPKHARNLFHTSVAMWDAWAAWQDVADGVVYTDRETAVDVDSAREIAISYASYRVLVHRYASAQNAAITKACFDAFMDELALDPTDVHTEGADPVAVGNRIGAAVIAAYANDGANEANELKDTTNWAPTNPVMVVDVPGTPATDPNTWQQLNLALAETQNGIVLDTTIQPYIGPQWREVLPFALERNELTGLYTDPPAYPMIEDEAVVAEVMDVIRKTAWLDHLDGETIDLSPGAYGNNPLGTNDGTGHPLNPATGEAYAPNPVARGDFARVLAEYWADGPKSETPPGHWYKIGHEISDEMASLGTPFVPWAEGEPVDRLTWDVALALAVTGATHDAAIMAWELKRDSLGPRPITLVRWMAQKGQRSDPSLPSYDPGGLPLEPGLTEVITEASSAPGERHHHLRWYVGEVAVRAWPGEPGDRANDFTRVQWMRALDWIPYQRRTFVTPAFPGFISGHSTFSRAAAEALATFTGSAFFPGGMNEFVAPASGYLIFEDGPATDVRLQWGTYYDAADQAGQSRIYGGIHIFTDDTFGRVAGRDAGLGASGLARAFLEGSAR